VGLKKLTHHASSAKEAVTLPSRYQYGANCKSLPNQQMHLTELCWGLKIPARIVRIHLTGVDV